MDPRALMRQVQKMQQDVEKAQAEAEAEVVTVTAGGGAVKVVISGALEIQSIEIQPDVVDPEDVEMLQDLVMAAVNEAISRAQEMVADRLSEATGGLAGGGMGGLGIPGL
jgi:hypothetical protein